MESNSDGIERLLRSTMAGPIPKLAPDFDQRLMRAVRQDSPRLKAFRGRILTSYALVSSVVCAVLMRGQGIEWTAIAVLVLTPLATVAIGRAAWSRTKKSNPLSAS